MYDQFYHFQGRPFQLTPDPHFYFESATHRKALSYLGYGLAQGEGFIVITGDIGAGKTTLVGHVMNSIDPERLTAVKIVSTQVQSDDLLQLVAQGFGISEGALPKAQMLRNIERFLHGQARKGLRTLLIVDEAQNLPASSVEELRMLSNFQLGGQALLQIFLLGQPEFRDLMHAPEMEQLRQRVIATHHLEPMQESELRPYIEHRLKLVGWQDDPHFTEDACQAIFQATAGVPRQVNALMSRTLLMGAVDQLHVIDARTIEAVIADMGLDASIEPENEPVNETAGQEGVPPAPAFAASQHEDAASGPLQTDVPPAVEQVAAFADRDAMAGEVESLRAEIASLRDLVNAISAPAEPGSDALAAAVADRLSGIESRLEQIEGRTEEQDAALRRVLNLLIDWVESDDNNVRAA